MFVCACVYVLKHTLQIILILILYIPKSKEGIIAWHFCVLDGLFKL